MTRLDDKREPRSKEGNNGEGQEVEREGIKSRTNNISPEAGTEREREREVTSYDVIWLEGGG